MNIAIQSQLKNQLNYRFINEIKRTNRKLQDLFNGECVNVTLLVGEELSLAQQLNLFGTYCVYGRPKGYEIYVAVDQIADPAIVQMPVEDEDMLSYVEFYLQDLGFQEVKVEMYWQLFRK